MADISDVENVLKTTITSVVYPNGTGQASILGTDCVIYRGWPQRETLDAYLAANKVTVSIFPSPVERRTTKYLQKQQVSNLPVTTLTAVVSLSAGTVTIGGTVSTPQNVAVIVAGIGVVHAVQAGDTLTSIATALAALLTTAGISASSSGPVITISGQPSTQIEARVGMVAGIVTETKRQKRNFTITFWCPTPDFRDQIASAVDAYLSGVDFLQLPDGTGGRILYENSRPIDQPKELLYRRDLVYSVEYGTTDISTAAQVLIERMTITGGNDPNDPTIYQRDT